MDYENPDRIDLACAKIQIACGAAIFFVCAARLLTWTFGINLTEPQEWMIAIAAMCFSTLLRD